MEITEPRRLYQQLAADLKERIEQGVYLVGEKLPAERFIADEKNVSRTVVREAIIMLEVEGYVEVRKGSGIHVISNQPKHPQRITLRHSHNLLAADTFQLRDRLHNLRQIQGAVSFSTVRHRCHVGAIGFKQDLIQRRILCHLFQLPGILKSNHSADSKIKSHIQILSCNLLTIREAVYISSNTFSMCCLHHIKCIPGSIS